jgi:Kdo2-lipid IVA lauroyltransferase/acyltransferase
MERVLYYLAVGLVALLQALPLRWVAWAGRQFGGLTYWLDPRHRRAALRNLSMCFAREKSAAEIRRMAQENFRRLGENYCCAIKTVAMSWDKLKTSVEFVSIEKIPSLRAGDRAQSHIVAIGHFGSFELYARFGQFMPGFECATTYRALKQPLLNQLMQSLRARSGCLFFERRTEAKALKTALGQRPLLLGLLADQHAGARGVRVPFFGHDCSTTAAPAVLALRYRCPLHTAVCYRIGLGRWRIEAGNAIPTHENGHPRSVAAITLDINRAFEAAVRQDPANWFWVHKRWKPAEAQPRQRPPPASVEDSEETKPLQLS